MLMSNAKFRRNMLVILVVITKQVWTRLNSCVFMLYIEKQRHSSSVLGEADSHSANQEIPPLLCNLKVRHRVQKFPLLGHLNMVPRLATVSLELYLLLPSRLPLSLFSVFPPFVFLHHNFVSISVSL